MHVHKRCGTPHPAKSGRWVSRRRLCHVPGPAGRTCFLPHAQQWHVVLASSFTKLHSHSNRSTFKLQHAVQPCNSADEIRHRSWHIPDHVTIYSEKALPELIRSSQLENSLPTCFATAARICIVSDDMEDNNLCAIVACIASSPARRMCHAAC